MCKTQSNGDESDGSYEAKPSDYVGINSSKTAVRDSGAFFCVFPILDVTLQSQAARWTTQCMKVPTYE